MEDYLRVRALLDEALYLLDSLGETLIGAHVATPIALLQKRLETLDGSGFIGPRRPA